MPAVKRRKHSPKEEREAREHGFQRIVGHAEVVGQEKITTEDGKEMIRNVTNFTPGILGMTNPTTADLWWARRFLRSVAANPLQPSEKHSALNILANLEKKWPEPKKPRRIKPAGVKLSKSQLLITKSLLRGVQKQLDKMKHTVIHWERKLNATPMTNPKWGDIYARTKELRKEQARLIVRRTELKARLK